jgi:hypothetical protein
MRSPHGFTEFGLHPRSLGGVGRFLDRLTAVDDHGMSDDEGGGI